MTPRDRTVIIGAGPGGLTAAYELMRLGQPAVILERDSVVGGLSRTVTYKGYRFDIGGHRFFTRHPEVEAVWHELLGDDLLERSRLSRIRYRGTFFDYPLRPIQALTKIGAFESIRIILSYFRACLRKTGDELTFEQWVVNRFGRRLYEIFFKGYTEKVWGLPCHQIGADWAAQRIKSLDLGKAITNSLFRLGPGGDREVTSLIDRFHYPRLGPGMMWERCRDTVAEHGIPTQTRAEVAAIRHEHGRAVEVVVRGESGTETLPGGSFVSSMPLPQLLHALSPKAPEEVMDAAANLRYRDFLTVVLIVDRADVFPDNWIYIQEPEVTVGRVQNFKNWSPEMVPDPARTALGLEYFVQAGDRLWSMSDDDLRDLGIREMKEIGLVDPSEVVDSTVVRVRRAYPVYDSRYREAVATIRGYLASFENLHVIGRNGQHRYNNQDHAMLTGILAARNISGRTHELWDVNAESVYHEESSPQFNEGGTETSTGRIPSPRAREPVLQDPPDGGACRTR